MGMHFFKNALNVCLQYLSCVVCIRAHYHAADLLVSLPSPQIKLSLTLADDVEDFVLTPAVESIDFKDVFFEEGQPTYVFDILKNRIALESTPASDDSEGQLYKYLIRGSATFIF